MAAELEKLYQEGRASKDRHRMRATAEVFLAMDRAMTDNLVGAMEITRLAGTARRDLEKLQDSEIAKAQQAQEDAQHKLVAKQGELEEVGQILDEPVDQVFSGGGTGTSLQARQGGSEYRPGGDPEPPGRRKRELDELDRVVADYSGVKAEQDLRLGVIFQHVRDNSRITTA
jgi:hypothetical protein